MALACLLVSVCCGIAPAAPAGSEKAPARPDPVILIGVDGVRWDALQRVDLPNLSRIARRGVSAEGLIPQFPSFSNVNFYTIATGLYPENHGIVHNAMYDPQMDETFDFGIGRDAIFDPENKDVAKATSFRDHRWWGGEPIWVTAEKQGLLAATFFWVGSEAGVQGYQPTYLVPFNPAIPHAERVDQVLRWLDSPEEARPSLITLYFDDVDIVTHIFGVETEREAAALRMVDAALGRLLAGLRARGLEGSVNLLVVSDHGFVNLDPARTIDLDDFFSLEEARVLEFEIYPATPVASFYPLGDPEAFYRRLQGAHPQLEVFRREELPDRFRNRDHIRVPPILALADEGWVMTSSRLLAERGNPRLFIGAHGYDPALRSMHGVFLASGPAFPKGKRVPSFENVHIYQLLAELLGLVPAPNDGSPELVRSLLER